MTETTVTNPQDFEYAVSPDTTPQSMGYLFTETLHQDTYSLISPLSLNLTNCSVLITGANKGLGRATAISYARAGANPIVLTIRRPAESPSLVADVIAAAVAANRPAPTVHVLTMDVISLGSVVAAVAEFKGKVGEKLDVLVNNAGVMPYLLPMLEQDEDSYWKGFEVNYRGTYYVTKNFLPLLVQGAEEGGLGTVVCLTSVAAQQVGMGASSYCVSKMAICRFAEFVNFEFAQKGIICYSVHPGGVRTDMSEDLPQSFFAAMLTDTPELAGDSIAFLTSERRQWLGGRYINVTWDMSELLAKEKEIVEKNMLVSRTNFG